MSTIHAAAGRVMRTRRIICDRENCCCCWLEGID